ncbi:uncharacterized protein METZ01_LOCUS314553 [marine metagenome]|uniref:Enoyl-CoA hydratase n=1 Tax=marine metagenome TaxID=408172 RepID=A0A382NKG8_9ZZZZ
MSNIGSYTDISVKLRGHIASVEICRPPHNFFDHSLIQQLADCVELLDTKNACRVIVLTAQGRSFCAGAQFAADSKGEAKYAMNSPAPLYVEAVRLFRGKKPIIAAIQGPAIGGGLGLSLVADFRIACPEARFAANFTKLGFHPGFGLTYTLPLLVGQSNAAMMFYTSRRVKGEEALQMGLVDQLVPQEDLRDAALELAAEISQCSPLGLLATRATVRGNIADKVRDAANLELIEQLRLRQTEDFAEGVKAVSERRIATFLGR